MDEMKIDAQVLRVYRARYLYAPDPNSSRDAQRLIDVQSWIRTVRAAAGAIYSQESIHAMALYALKSLEVKP